MVKFQKLKRLGILDKKHWSAGRGIMGIRGRSKRSADSINPDRIGAYKFIWSITS